MFACCCNDASNQEAVLVESFNTAPNVVPVKEKEPEPEVNTSVEEDPPAPPPPEPVKEEPEPVKEDPPPANPEPTPAPAPAPAPTPAAEPPGLKVVFATLTNVMANVGFIASFELADSELVKRERKTVEFKKSMGMSFTPGVWPLDVAAVTAGSEAQAAGVSKGWQILQIGDTNMEKMQETEAIGFYRKQNSFLAKA